MGKLFLFLRFSVSTWIVKEAHYIYIILIAATSISIALLKGIFPRGGKFKAIVISVG